MLKNTNSGADMEIGKETARSTSASKPNERFLSVLRPVGRRWSTCALLLLAGHFNLAANAADIAVATRIDEVKVYVEGAGITRTGHASIPAGTHRLVIKDLPSSIDTDTLRLSVASPDVRLGGIEVERITNTEFVSAAERELRARLVSLADQRSVLQDEIATAETQLKLLDSLATAPSGSATKPTVDATNLASLLGTIATSANAARTRIREAKVRERDLVRETEKVQADLQKIATSRKSTLEVRASLEASSAVSPTVTVEYTMDDAEWRWIYEARLDTVAKRVVLGRQASVAQRTGEDWKNAVVTLTTAQPAEDAATPKLSSLFVKLEEPELRQSAGGIAGTPTMMSEIVVTGQRRSNAQLIATDYLADYRIPGRVTLGADDQPRLYAVAEDAYEIDLVARVVPSASRSAHLEAAFKFTGEVPMQGGELQLYRDGAFVGTAEMSSLLPDADVRIPFGADERIRVVVRNEAEDSGRRGIVSRSKVDEHKQRFEITNYHATPVAIEVLDRLPVSQNKDVRIEVLDGATAPTTKDFEGKAGLLLWRIDAQPKQTASIRHYYSVRYPEGQEVKVYEGEEDG